MDQKLQEQTEDNISFVDPKENREYKDSIFVDLFSKCSTAKENTLSLYNALHGTNYQDGEDIQFFLLDGVLYQNFKNDVSFVFQNKVLVLGEHQSTINENMPVRCLMYVAREYEKLIPHEAKYKRRMITLPKPEFIVFYNGVEKHPKEKILKLSDAFAVDDSLPNVMELEVRVININSSAKHEILQNCEVLSQYSQFVDITRECANDGTRLQQAINKCIEQGILAEYLKEKGSEVINMLLSEYNYDTDIATQREESKAEGFSQGLSQGLNKSLISTIHMCQQFGKTLTETVQAISENYQLSEKEVEYIVKKYWN